MMLPEGNLFYLLLITFGSSKLLTQERRFFQGVQFSVFLFVEPLQNIQFLLKNSQRFRKYKPDSGQLFYYLLIEIDCKNTLFCSPLTVVQLWDHLILIIDTQSPLWACWRIWTFDLMAHTVALCSMFLFVHLIFHVGFDSMFWITSFYWGLKSNNSWGNDL